MSREDEALIAEAQAWLFDNLTMNPNLHYVNVQRLATRLRAALADVARLRVQRDLQRTAIQAQEERHSAALAAAEQEKEKAVAEEQTATARAAVEWCAGVARGNGAKSTATFLDESADYNVKCILRIRARAGRNDG